MPSDIGKILAETANKLLVVISWHFIEGLKTKWFPKEKERA